ncbi:related to alpha glucosidase II beta subunit [Ustilago sp. UG-2017b]|nr:related to alpha glucosidase II beta subunit [Ustilago sp. UG-2017b]
MVRLNLAVAALAAGVISASASASSPTTTEALRGISPADAAKYQAIKTEEGQLRWKCLDGSKELSWTSINDDYCDCADGSDERGTSACPNSAFYCANSGHVPAYIPSSRVDDGICDPECCDGSDEADGKADCPDRCEKVGKEHRKKMAQLENLRRAGGKIRDKYIADGSKQKQLLEAEIAKLQIQVQVAAEKEARLKHELTRAETSDKAAIDAKIKTPLYAKLSQHQEAIKQLNEKNAALKSELQTLTLLLDDLAKGYNPNYQDMAVKGAVLAYKQWRTSTSNSADSSAEAGVEGQSTVDQLAAENRKLTQLLDEGDWPASKLSALLAEDPLDIMEGGIADHKRLTTESDGGLLFRIHEYLPDGVVPYFEAMVDTLLDVLIKANVITDVKRMRPKSASSAPSPSSTESEPESITSARLAHSNAAAHLSRITNELGSRREKLSQFSTRYGRSAEFKALENKCISKDTGEYTYEYCFFGRATQIPNNGGAHISLGTFANFNPKNDSTWQQDHYWLQQIYARGHKCWNGPERSALVHLQCGVENSIEHVFEAEKCIYSFTVATPAVCFPVEHSQKQAHYAVRDEL